MAVFSAIGGILMGVGAAAGATTAGAFATGLIASAAVAGAAGYASSASHQASKAAKSQARVAQQVQAGNLKMAEEKQAQAAATAESEAKASVKQKKKAIARFQTVFTSPRGIYSGSALATAQEANLAKKTLLGA